MTEPDDSTATDDATETGSADGRPTWRRVLNVLGLVLLVAFVLPFVAYAVPMTVGAEHSYVVLSGSMEPTLSPGDVVFVDDVPASSIDEGDVINFRQTADTRTTTHRVVEVVERDDGVAFRTKGDNNEDPDRELVDPSEVQGRLLSVGGSPLVVPYVGYVIQFAATQTGFALLVLGPLALLFVSEVWNVVASTQPQSGEEGDREVDEGEGPPDDAATDAGDGATAGSTTTADASGGGDGLTIRPMELRLGVGILVAFLIYSVVVAFVTTEPWTVGVAASVAVAFALLAGLYFFGGGDGATGESGTDPGEGTDDDPGDSGTADDPAVPVAATGGATVTGSSGGRPSLSPSSEPIADGTGVPPDGGHPTVEAPASDGSDEPADDRPEDDRPADEPADDRPEGER